MAPAALSLVQCGTEFATKFSCTTSWENASIESDFPIRSPDHEVAGVRRLLCSDQLNNRFPLAGPVTHARHCRTPSPGVPRRGLGAIQHTCSGLPSARTCCRCPQDRHCIRIGIVPTRPPNPSLFSHFTAIALLVSDPNPLDAESDRSHDRHRNPAAAESVRESMFL